MKPDPQHALNARAQNVAPVSPLLIGLGAIVFGAFIYAVLPQGVVALNDDFGYLRSVVASLQRGRIWTDDWLEPWAAGFTGASALLFLGTKSFYFATYGLLAGLAGTSFFFATKLLTERGTSLWRAFLVGALGLTFPTVLWKEVQFTGMALYMPCLLAAIWTAEHRRWGWFLVTWVLALSTRQSALVWGALPVAAVLIDGWTQRKLTRRQWLEPLAILVVGALTFYLVGRFMNRTVAQKVVTEHMWDGWHWTQAWTSIRAAVVMLAIAIGLAACAFGRVTRPAGRTAVWRYGIGAGVLVAAGLLLFANLYEYVAVEFETLGTAGGTGAYQSLIVVGALGLALGSFAWRPVPAAGAMAAVAVLTFRATIWDYYLVDVAVFGFFALAGGAGSPQPSAASRWLGRAVLTGLLVCHGLVVLHVKRTLDRAHALTVISSRALESGQLPPNHTSFLPFGLMAWYYFPLYVQRMDPNAPDLGDFGRYLEQDTVQVAWRYSRRLRSLPGHDGTLPSDRSGEIIMGKFNYCWLYGVEVMLVRAPVSEFRPAKEPYPSGYRLPTFPADDAGWRELIAQETKLAVP